MANADSSISQQALKSLFSPMKTSEPLSRGTIAALNALGLYQKPEDEVGGS